MYPSLWGALVWLAVSASGDVPDPPMAGVQADVIAATAASSSPLVLKAEAELLALEGRLAQSQGLMANPTLQGSVDLGGARAGGQLSQPISYAGQGRANRRAAALLADAVSLERDRARMVAARQARSAFALACASAEQRRLAETGARVAARITEVTEARSAVGDVPLLELQLARLSEARAQQSLMAAAIEEARALQLLSAWAQVPLQSAQLPADPFAAVPHPSGVEVEGRERSDLRAAALRMEGAEAEVSVAQAKAAPPVSLRLFYEREMGQTFAGPGISIPIPLFDRAQEARGAATGARAVARSERDALAARVTVERATAAELRALAEGALSVADRAGADTVSDAIEGIGRGYEAGELDLTTTLMLQQQVLAGAVSALALRRDAAEAWLSWLLAIEDPALLGGRMP